MAPRDPTKGDFGAWVIRQREALGLSREELAVELYRYVPSIGKLSVSTIGTLEESLKSLDREIRQALEQFFHSRLHGATPSLDQLRGVTHWRYLNDWKPMQLVATATIVGHLSL